MLKILLLQRQKQLIKYLIQIVEVAVLGYVLDVLALVQVHVLDAQGVVKEDAVDVVDVVDVVDALEDALILALVAGAIP